MDKASVRKVKIVEVQKQGLLQFPYIFLQQRERERKKSGFAVRNRNLLYMLTVMTPPALPNT